MRPVMPAPTRVGEHATREHGRAEDRRGPQRRAELIGQAPSHLVLRLTNASSAKQTAIVGRDPVSHAGRRTRSPRTMGRRRSATARPRDRPLSVIGRLSGQLKIDQAVQPIHVEPHHPRANSLSRHAGGLCRLHACGPLENRRQRQQPLAHLAAGLSIPRAARRIERLGDQNDRR